MATELLQAGDSERAIATISELRRVAHVNSIPLPEPFDAEVRRLAANSWLRLGE